MLRMISGLAPGGAAVPRPRRLRFAGNDEETSVLDAASGIHSSVRHYTHMFRPPYLFSGLAAYLSQRFPQGAPIYIYAGSDGSEAYSLTVKLADQLGTRAARHRFPIRSIDIQPKWAERGKKGLITLFDYERDDFARHTSQRFETLFTKDRECKKPNEYKIPLDWRVAFDEGNLLDDLARKRWRFNQPGVLMFRNAWYHLEDRFQAQLAGQLFETLKPGSLLVIGESENQTHIVHARSYLEQVGFKPVTDHFLSEFVFERPTEPPPARPPWWDRIMAMRERPVLHKDTGAIIRGKRYY